MDNLNTEVKPLRAVIIEDEQKARRILQTLLEENCDNVKVVGIAEDVPTGVKTIIAENPDVVFLDIELPGFNGFELADFFTEINFEIIFTTAYSQYAIKAFQMSAVDYLLKPMQIDQLRNAVEKARKIRGAQMLEKIKALKENMADVGSKKIALPIAEGFLFVEQNEIVYLEADNSYTTIFFTNGNKILVSRNLKEFIALIDSPDFFKPHRSYYVNSIHIRQYNKQDNGSLVMNNGHTIYIARDRKQEFLDFMQHKGAL